MAGLRTSCLGAGPTGQPMDRHAVFRAVAKSSIDKRTDTAERSHLDCHRETETWKEVPYATGSSKSVLSSIKRQTLLLRFMLLRLVITPSGSS